MGECTDNLSKVEPHILFNLEVMKFDLAEQVAALNELKLHV